MRVGSPTPGLRAMDDPTPKPTRPSDGATKAEILEWASSTFEALHARVAELERRLAKAERKAGRGGGLSRQGRSPLG